MLDKCRTECSNSFNTIQHFREQSVVWMLNKSLNRFKFDSTRFRQAFNIFYTFNNVERPVQTPPTLTDC